MFNPAISSNARVLTLIRVSLAVYFFMLIFEGALRKWILPGLASPLLLVREPVAIIILFMAWRNQLLVRNGYLVAVIIICLISFFTSILLGHGDIVVALYGLRIYMLHLPLIFVIEKVYNRKEVMKVVRWMLLLSIPMLVLITWQFYSPQSAWVNLGVGGETVEGFMGALGFFRPSGTFSFTNGLTTFFGLVIPLSLYALLKPTGLPRWLEYLAFICVLLSIPFSISRTVFFQLLLSCFFLVFATFRNTRLLFAQVGVGMLVVLLYFMSGSNAGLATGVEAFEDRLGSANEAEGGAQDAVVGRTVGASLSAFQQMGDLPFFGMGIGLGTNAGSKLSTGEVSFVISEGEWGRLIGEMGAVLGIALIMIRLLVSWKIISASYRQLRIGNYLPWLLCSAVLLLFVQGQWGQPTALGFSVFFTGLALAALKGEESFD